MRKVSLLTLLFCFCMLSTTQVQAQEHWTEGPVWVVNYYRTKPGKFDDYLYAATSQRYPPSRKRVE